MPISLSFDTNISRDSKKICQDLLPLSTHLMLNIHCDNYGLTLQDLGPNALNDFRLSFLDKTHTYLAQTLSKKQPLWRALQLQKPMQPIVVDCTSGFGTDSFSLNHLGAQVISLERNPIIAKILSVTVALLQTQTSDKIHSWQVHHIDAEQWLANPSADFSHIYMDPFFLKKGFAKPKNPMQWLQKITQEDQPDPEILFTKARKSRAQSIIVKRAKVASFIAKCKPDRGSLFQKSSRFDCYSPILTRRTL